MRTAAFIATDLLALASADATAAWIACAKEDGFCVFDGRREDVDAETLNLRLTAGPVCTIPNRG